MRKRRALCGFILLLLVLLAPTSAVASPGTFENGVSRLVTVWGQLVALMTDLLGGAVPPDDAANETDIGPLWDPWG